MMSLCLTCSCSLCLVFFLIAVALLSLFCPPCCPAVLLRSIAFLYISLRASISLCSCFTPPILYRSKKKYHSS
ncbi:hypothetical protein EDB92DRAFT_1230349 [Lactarius akahatsu]|uniref:Uncharacterized protein n=1 Tax=Lactarius akahatsu TaxID=416441 RepID=A0AAD4LD72_9AGAM|nr:hypothetical protein EDB92DRAFT_1230349 [Lactarius akahatsu]